MPPSMALIHKGPTLRVIDEFVKNSSYAELYDIKNELDALDPADPGIVAYARGHEKLGVLAADGFAGSQLDHLQNHWFNTTPPDAYWPGLKYVEAIFLAGLKQAIHLSLNNTSGYPRTQHLPLDSYWLVLGCDFKVAVMLNGDQRVTMLVITPPPAAAVAPPPGPENIWLAQEGPSGAIIGQ